ncbi:MAG: ABC transporter permease [archaeon]
MKFATSVKLAANILLHSKLRSWLTIIGIVIGVAAVVAIVSIGEGMQQSIESRLGGLGADIITISPGGSRAMGGFREAHFDEGFQAASSGGNLTTRDIQVLRSISGVKFIEGTISGRAEIYYLGEKTTMSVTGVDPAVWKYITTAELDSGRLLGPGDSNVVVVGYRLAQSTFKQPLAVNRVLTIEGSPFKIVGILAEGTDDRSIIMPISAAETVLEDAVHGIYNSITLKAEDESYVDQIIADADSKLMASRHVTERKKDYSITSAKVMQENISAITSTMTIFLGAIAAVSLIVGAVGIANTMFTSVLEKTKEIGIMKAIGAKNRDITVIFLLNAALVGVVGGVLGISLGAAISYTLPSIGVRIMGQGGMLTTAIPLNLVAFAFGISISIGMIAGAVPAYRASKLKPVDALRYE